MRRYSFIKERLCRGIQRLNYKKHSNLIGFLNDMDIYLWLNFLFLAFFLLCYSGIISKEGDGRVSILPNSSQLRFYVFIEKSWFRSANDWGSIIAKTSWHVELLVIVRIEKFRMERIYHVGACNMVGVETRFRWMVMACWRVIAHAYFILDSAWYLFG